MCQFAATSSVTTHYLPSDTGNANPIGIQLIVPNFADTMAETCCQIGNLTGTDGAQLREAC